MLTIGRLAAHHAGARPERVPSHRLHAASTLRKSVGLSRAAHQIRPAIGDPVHDRDRNVPVSPII